MKKIVVTGGGGFVGQSIVRLALERGLECTVVGRNRYPSLEALGVECLAGDIRDTSFMVRAVRGADAVFHVAALAGIWGPWVDYHSINVLGTESVLAACKESGVSQLVYTSTPSVVFDRHHIEGGNESLPYPSRFLCNYAKSKVMAEKLILSANGGQLATCAIRPHLIWGPGDPHLVPRLLQKGKKRELKRVGDGDNLVDISYVDNVAHAHFLAADNLCAARSAAGKAYFVSQCQPVKLWDWINELFVRVGIAPVTASVPFSVAYAAGATLELFHGLFQKEREPRMTRFLAEQLAKSHYFSCAAIERDLDYSPIVSTAAGMEKLVKWIEHNEKILL